MAIRELDYIVLKKDANWKTFQLIKRKQIWMCKTKFVLDGIVGHRFGSSFKILNGQLVKLDGSHLVDEDNFENDEAVLDNRDLVDDSESQKTSKEELHTMHKQGVTGDEIVEHLVKNSSTFSKKTEFSQQKYIKKKRKKHVTVFTVLKPNTRSLIELYYSRGPTKICNLRMDSLAQILTQSNIHANTRSLVVETCSGLVIGAILERLGGFGSVVHLYTGTAPNRPALTDGYNFPKNIMKSLYSFPLNESNTLRCSPAMDLKDGITAATDCQASMISPKSLAAAITNNTLGNNGDHTVAADSKPDNHPEEREDISAEPVSCEEPVTTSSVDREMSDFVERRASDVCDDLKMSDPGSVEQFSSSHQGVGEKRKLSVTDDAPGKSAGRSRSRNRNRKSSKHGHHGEYDPNQRQEDSEERERRRLIRLEQIQKAKAVIESGNMDCLIIATKFHPTPIVLRLLEFVAPSRPIVVFSPYKEPLLDCFMKLKETNRVLMIKLSETWLRSYQVLPDRTHPSINMSGGGGYMLTAMTVELPTK